jgi:hypothetical protein
VVCLEQSTVFEEQSTVFERAKDDSRSHQGGLPAVFGALFVSSRLGV